ncbi:hypothetical protein MLD38_010869 [Melastoma candidum]|uniref:Uncharacterized protein n=1 Tax=Melastoma candidum TaxID=119954 RepID=A0ACB9R4B6_9MYRT|nr:hypothetical protein MLD38_010869 [Melastoma candidum]
MADVQLKAATAVVLGVSGILLLWLLDVLLWKPRSLLRKLNRQGIPGPPSRSFFLGNIPDMDRIGAEAKRAADAMGQTQGEGAGVISHDWPSVGFSYLLKWRDEYGPNFIYSMGQIPFLCVTDMDLVKELCLSTTPSLGKPLYLSRDLGPLFGEGIVSSSGPSWTFQRKIVAPQLYLDKVLNMVDLMVGSAEAMVRSWEGKIESEGGMANMRVDDDLRSLAADIIARACFGSSYKQGEEIFKKLRELQGLLVSVSVGVPILRYVPMRKNRAMWKLEEEIESMILETVKARKKDSSEKDLMQMILESADQEGLPPDMSSQQFIVDNCKNIYFAGHETTATTSSWCLMLLAANPEWQDRARAEVVELLKDGQPDSSKIRGMKTLTMVIHETLRLYAPAMIVVRRALQDVKFKNLRIPKGCNIQLPISILHRLPDIWGKDWNEFNPQRFVNGVSGACKSVQAYMPFGVGPRVCVGQHFAMLEMKVVLSLILSRFSFSLSPDYLHAPERRLVLEPGHGVILHITKV